jgi:NAD(P)H-hydrate epimerase
MLAIDRDAIERLRIPAHTLMETAGRAVASAIAQLYADLRRPLVVCGGGNNGGDGYVIARVLAGQGRGVAPRVLELGGTASRSPEAKANRDLLATVGVEVRRAASSADVTASLAGCDLVVDAVFGVGLARPVEGPIAECLRALSASGLPCVAVDLPSGLSSETGQPLGLALEATLIVTLGVPKLGLALYPKAARILVADIGLPAECVTRANVRQHVLTRAGARALLPARPLDAHKGTFGHVLVVGGSLGKTGAALLAAQGALRGGAGLVSVATPRALYPIYAAALAEVMCVVLDEAPTDSLGPAQLESLARALETRDALVLGPGLGQAPNNVVLVRALLARARVPAVVDADALNAFGTDLAALRSDAPSWIARPRRARSPPGAARSPC